MTAEPVRVEANPATSEPNTSGPAEGDQILQSLSQLLVSDRPVSELLEEAKQLARNLSNPEANTEAEPPPATAIDQVRKSCADAVLSERDIIERLRAAVAARIQREEKRRPRILRLWTR